MAANAIVKFFGCWEEMILDESVAHKAAGLRISVYNLDCSNLTEIKLGARERSGAMRLLEL